MVNPLLYAWIIPMPGAILCKSRLLAYGLDYIAGSVSSYNTHNVKGGVVFKGGGGAPGSSVIRMQTGH